MHPQRRSLAEICEHVEHDGQTCDFRAYVTSVGRVLAAQLTGKSATLGGARSLVEACRCLPLLQKTRDSNISSLPVAARDRNASCPRADCLGHWGNWSARRQASSFFLCLNHASPLLFLRGLVRGGCVGESR